MYTPVRRYVHDVAMEPACDGVFVMPRSFGQLDSCIHLVVSNKHLFTEMELHIAASRRIVEPYASFARMVVLIP